MDEGGAGVGSGAPPGEGRAGADPRAFVEVSALAPVGWQELVAEALSAPGCTGVAFGPRSLVAGPPPEGRELVRAFYPAAVAGAALEAELRARLTGLAAAVGEVPEEGAEEQGGGLAGLELELRALPPEDWATTWRKVWRPLRVGRVCVVPPDRAGALRPRDVRLVLEPGAAFGTGRHATTRRALAALQARLGPGERVVDAGCGTGILAVAACLLGAAEATGFDLDANAVAHADELARVNGVADRARFLQVDLERLGAAPHAALAEPADGLLANLYGDLVRAHAGALAALVRPGGWFVITGCLGEVRGAVRAALGEAGLDVEELHSRGRWDAFAGTRRAGSGRPG